MDNRFEEILQAALKLKSTDIHFDLIDNQVNIFFRCINGLLKYESNENDLKLFNYLQYKAHLDITDNKPQTGAFTYFYDGKYYDFRLASVSSNSGKNSVLRILNCHVGLSFEELTYDKSIHKVFLRCINQRSGLILFSGLTGSGKTTTMYSLLQMIKNKIIYSLEDPIEVLQENIIQLEVNEKIDFGYDEGIKQILRHNPDVLMIGEIRDEKTAKMAIRASLTGCLVFSSIHAKSCKSAINRIMELGVDKNDLQECCSVIFNQRLFKKYNCQQYTCIYEFIERQQIEDYFAGKDIKERMIDKIKHAEKMRMIQSGECL